MSTGTAFIVFSSVTALVFCLGIALYELVLRYRIALNKRVSELGAEEELSLFRDPHDKAKERTSQLVSLSERLTQMIAQAGVSCSIATLLRLCLGLSITCGLIGAFHSLIAAGILAIAGGLLPVLILHVRRHVRNRQLAKQLPNVFRMISRSVRAGRTIPGALKTISEEFPSPVSDEFGMCCEQQNLGMSYQAALRKLAERTAIMEMQIFVVALLVQSKYGGDLVEMLENLALSNQKRFKLKDRVRTLTGEGRMQAAVLFVLPILALIGILLIAPDYSAALLDHPSILAATGVAQLIAAVWIHRIVNFEY